ncbi:MAG TPA: class I SAM-dependent methyltransferase [Clostridia bacterium]|jgi:ubiquinone/menaquinone biosynthesis C-methylase UbiE|nr:class I SAM-dependent methyltransferase [Clostridia bacterium]HQC68211.1 class I SAM-dependent methyltransferase [Clostridia bacterium]
MSKGDETLVWDRVAGIYDIFVYIINAKVHKALRNHIKNLFEPSDIVLECACGTGMLTECIALRCKKLTATDFSKNMVQTTKYNCRNHKNISFAVADINNLEFADAAFDKVVAANVIHLLEDPYKALDELDRVCKPNGKMIITTYIVKQEKKRKNVFTETISKGTKYFKREFSFSSYKQFFIDAGYSDVQCIDIDGFIPCSIAIMGKRGD